MKNAFIIIGSLGLAACIAFFCYTMLQKDSSYPVNKDFSFDSTDPVEDKKSEVVDRIKELDSKPLNPAEHQTLIKEFSNGNGAKYNLTKEEQLKLMESLNNQPR